MLIIFCIHLQESCRIAEKNGNILRSVVYISAHLSAFSKPNHRAYKKGERIEKRIKLAKLVREKGRKIQIHAEKKN